jgi:peptidoglycan/LPS O-acetylase OafA/YrhL
MRENKYFYSLDLFRGFCGYGVAICHLHAFIYQNAHMEYLSLLFVEFFFVLSGFVLYPQLVKVLENKKNLIIFYKRRWLRTLPLYVIMLLIVSALLGKLLSGDFFKYLFFIQKVVPNFLNTDYYPIAWSLSIEEFFYLLFPIIILMFNKNNFIKNTVIIFLSIFIIKYFLSPYIESQFFRIGTILRFDAILLGFLLRHFFSYIEKFKISIISLFILTFILFYVSKESFVSSQSQHEMKYLFIIVLQILSVLFLIIFTYIEPLMKNNFLRNFSLLVSKQTYSIYLMHIILIYLLGKIQLSIIITNFIYIISLFILSFLIFNFIEKPLLALRPKIR